MLPPWLFFEVIFIFFEVIFISIIATSPGRWFLGISIKTNNGKNLSFEQALKRSSLVFVNRLLLLGFFPFSLWKIKSYYVRLVKTGTTSWDNAANSVVIYRDSWKFNRLVTAMAILLSILLLGGDFSPRWIQKAADQGYASAQNKLGFMYDTGDGVAKNKYLAVQWYQKAADQGNASAQYNLGVMYDTGDGVAKNKDLAVQWYQKAADQGHASAQYNLGVIYANGDGVAKNNYLAVQWYQKAADQGLAEALMALKSLRK